eukprot:TRINITY_DN19668_c0_g1_i1.p1 TRINITY_DN19668_c0_g1~~TRINITY_DN19668_c0_g1_i1.p1  ORF type:complete len:156 (+),score=24.43 TRINITY_DN19668_c0_g1_i1:218-685(+)
MLLLQKVLLLQSLTDVSLVVLTLSMHPILFNWVMVDDHVSRVTHRDPNSLLGLYVRVFGWFAVALGLSRLQAALQRPSRHSFALAAASELLEFVWFGWEVKVGSFDLSGSCGEGILEPCASRVVSSILLITGFMTAWCGMTALFLGSRPPKHKVG